MVIVDDKEGMNVNKYALKTKGSISKVKKFVDT